MTTESFNSQRRIACDGQAQQAQQAQHVFEFLIIKRDRIKFDLKFARLYPDLLYPYKPNTRVHPRRNKICPRYILFDVVFHGTTMDIFDSNCPCERAGAERASKPSRNLDAPDNFIRFQFRLRNKIV